MRSIKGLLVTMLTALSITTFAQSDSTSFKAAGNCGMCKKRIESSVKDPGVTLARWDVKSKIMTVKFDVAKITAKQLQQRVAAAGHDTDLFTADQAVYDQLPGCCLYDREQLKNLPDQSKTKSGH